MIVLAEPLAAGAAVRLILYRPRGAAECRVLRRGSDAFTGATDPGAFVAADWGDYHAVVDVTGLVDGTPVFYRPYWRDAAGAVLPDQPTVQVTPSVRYTDASPDVLGLVRDRLAHGLAHAVAQGRLHPHSGAIQVITAPFALAGTVTFPCVSVHLNADQPSDRSIGDLLLDLPEDDEPGEERGWLSQVTINVVGVSLNMDERAALGRVLKAVVLANLDVWSAHGCDRVSFSLSHTEPAPEGNNAPLYVAAGSFTCFAKAAVAQLASPVDDVMVAAVDPA